MREDFEAIFVDTQGTPDRFMTMGYMVKENMRERLKGVINIDGSCRPQMVSDEDPRYRRLLLEIKKATGLGVLLNTSFNLHGEPMVCSPEDAVKTLIKTGNRYMVIGEYSVINNSSEE